MNAFQLSSTQTFRQGLLSSRLVFTLCPGARGIIDGAAIKHVYPLSRKPIIQPVPRGSSLRRQPPLIRKAVAYMFKAGLQFIRYAQVIDESLVTAKRCRDAFLSTSNSANSHHTPGNKCLASHRSASLDPMAKISTIVSLIEHSVVSFNIHHTSLRDMLCWKSKSERSEG